MPFKMQGMSIGFVKQLNELLEKRDTKTLKGHALLVSTTGNPKDLQKSAVLFGKLGIDVNLDIMVAPTAYHGLWIFKPDTEEAILERLSGAEMKKPKAASPPTVRAKMVSERINQISVMIKDDNERKQEYVDQNTSKTWPKWMKPNQMQFSKFDYPSNLLEFENLIVHVETVCMYAFEIRLIRKWWEQTKHTLQDGDVSGASEIVKARHVMEA